jgi:hypothetical protein
MFVKYEISYYIYFILLFIEQNGDVTTGKKIVTTLLYCAGGTELKAAVYCAGGTELKAAVYCAGGTELKAAAAVDRLLMMSMRMPETF